MGLRTLLEDGGILLVALASIIQVSPIRINPWSALARFVGKAVNADLIQQVSKIQETLDEHLIESETRDADTSRARIFRFNNELLRGIPHTKEEFDAALIEVDLYERFCAAHKDYKNNVTALTIENIRSCYRERMKKHDFLPNTIEEVIGNE